MNTIELVQGTIFNQNVKIYENGKVYAGNSNDVFLFEVRNKTNFKQKVFSKNWSGEAVKNGILEISIRSAETKNIFPNNYKYELYLLRNNERYSLIYSGDFILLPSIIEEEEEG